MRLSTRIMMTLSALLFSLVLADCRGRVEPVTSEMTADKPGEAWLRMSPRERTDFVSGFISGYKLGTLEGCTLADRMTKQVTPDVVEEMKRSNFGTVAVCMERVGDFTRMTPSVENSQHYDVYVDKITALYQQYPDVRNQTPSVVMLRLKDGEDPTTSQLHIDAEKSILPIP